MRSISVAVTVAIAILSGACVSKGRYDEAVSDAWTTRAELETRKESLAKANDEISRLQAEREERAKELSRLKLELWLQDRAAGADRRYASLRVTELAKRLSELEHAQAAAEAQIAMVRSVSDKLRAQISAGDLDVVVRDGRMVLRLPNDVLFDTGRTELKAAGKKTLAEVAGVLTAYPGRRFQIAGHADDVPIGNDRFPSNWELSTARSMRVLHVLVASGVAPDALSVAGYGSVDPIVPNWTPEGRKLNRRIEITVQPAIEEVVRPSPK